ncbi:hypothetical protein JOY44_16150 [Phormidium sp. CLA17]|uniref:hypothetical protein n=1 Tax=Leptolyngbya sp. Cla-17 TaxID=2803751 RepID=UPI00149179B3|nr:hypothetical protein [Leptolyngbya sp. Cla-17]MBM0743121.1 hypothetical protein [Leptolyngbya sp. Cla-17]
MLMRSLGFAIASVMWAISGSAQMLTLPARTTGLTPIKGKITAVQSVRIPVGSATTGSETQVMLKFTLQGCLDKLMPVMFYPKVQGNRVTFYVTALNAHTEKSQVARCLTMPQASAQTTVPGVFQRNQVQIVFLDQAPSTAPVVQQ